MKFSRRSFLKSVAAVAAVTAAGIALPTSNAVAAMIEPEVQAKIFPAAAVPNYEQELARAMKKAAYDWEQSVLSGRTFTWTPQPSARSDPFMGQRGVWTPEPFPHPFNEPEKYALVTGRTITW